MQHYMNYFDKMQDIEEEVEDKIIEETKEKHVALNFESDGNEDD